MKKLICYNITMLFLFKKIFKIIKFKLFLFKYGLSTKVVNVKYIVWNKWILLFWYRLYIRKDEFHKSLDLDICAMSVMSQKEKEKYLNDIMKRRQIAHIRDLKLEFN